MVVPSEQEIEKFPTAGGKREFPTVFEAGIWERYAARKPNGNVNLNPMYTGKVYVYKDKDQVERLEGVNVYDLDMNWYDNEGKRHPIQEKYKGRKYSLHFKICGLKDKDGKMMDFEHMALSPMRVGELGPIDFEGIHDSEQLVIDFGLKHGMFSGYNDPYIKKFLHDGATAYCVLCSPGAKWDDIIAFHYLLTIFFLIDDQIDNPSELGRTLSYGEITVLRDRFAEVLKGEKRPEEQEVDFHFPKLKPICHYFDIMRQVLLKKGATREIVERFVKDMIEYLDGVAMGMSSDWMEAEKKSKSGAHHRAKTIVRLADSGLLACQSCQLVDYDNRLDQKVHLDVLFQHMRVQCMSHVVLFNDLVSYKKEVDDGETCSNVFLRHQFGGEPLEKVLEGVLHELNRCAMDICDLESFIVKCFKGDPELKQAVYLQKAMMMGHMLFYSYAPRYFKNCIQFDVVVHPEDEDWHELYKKKLPKNFSSVA